MTLRSTVFIALGLVLGGCASTIDSLPFPTHRKSHLVNGELTELRMFTGAPGDLATNDQIWTAAEKASVERVCAPTVGFATLALLPIAIDFAGSQLKKAVDEFASSFEATWSARVVDEFYGPAGNPKNICFALRRAVDSDTVMGGRTVFLYVGKVEPSADKFALRFKPVFFRYEGTKARVGNDGQLNAGITLTFEAVWGDRKSGGVVNVQGKVFTASIALGQIDLDQKGPGYIEGAEAEAGSSTWFPAIPVSRSDTGGAIGTGPFTLTATVTETALARDLIGTMAANANSLIDDAAGRLKDQVKP